MDAWAHLRKTNNSIPNETLDFMRDVSIEKIEAIENKLNGNMCEWDVSTKNIICSCGNQFAKSIGVVLTVGDFKCCPYCTKLIKIKGN